VTPRLHTAAAITAAVEVHTPCGREDTLPPPCRYGHVAPTSVGLLRGRCRVARIGLGEHLYFGSVRPEGTSRWLQIGPHNLDPLPAGRVLSGVTGHLWVTAESGGGRVMVENLSSSVTIEIRSQRLPASAVLHPVDAEELAGERWLGTPIVALQTSSATLLLQNAGHEFTAWTVATTSRWDAPFPSRGTMNVRDHGEVDIDEAAMRIELGSPDHLALLRAFVDDPVVRRRLRSSSTLREFLANPTANRTGTTDADGFCARQIERVVAGKATHELHRLILEGLGQSPAHASKHYTDEVRALIEPQRERSGIRGGGGGLSELVGQVRARFRFRPHQLASYLGIDGAR
jgi:hypothetical protein